MLSDGIFIIITPLHNINIYIYRVCVITLGSMYVWSSHIAVYGSTG